MAGLKLYISNKVELLFENLCSALEESAMGDPMQKEIIAVENKGMEQWLTINLASHFGIVANHQFPFPNRIIEEYFEIEEGIKVTHSHFSPQVMTWQLYRILMELENEPPFSLLKNYIGDPVDPVRAFQLGTAISQIFDQYQVYRPEMILAWDNDDPDWQNNADDLLTETGINENVIARWKDSLSWQKPLWQKLSKGKTDQHRPARFKDVISQWKTTAPSQDLLPARICFFGITSLPYLLTQALVTLSQYCEFHLFLIHPTSDPHWKGGNTSNGLLNSWGQHGISFWRMLDHFMENPKIQENFGNPNEEVKQPTMLSVLQSDLLKNEEALPPLNIKSEDHSIQVHLCHSPIREVEILYDYLLGLFERTQLKPREILVLTPDIEIYAPLIEAVFNSGGDDQKEMRIPFSITGRMAHHVSPLVEDLVKLFKLLQSRFEAPLVMDFLRSERVMRRFDLDLQDMEKLQVWIQESQVRWGRDEEHRKEVLGDDVTVTPENTWQAGMDRLLLGLCMKSEKNELFQNSLIAFDDIEGSDGLILGRFLEFQHALFEGASAIKAHPKWSMEQWNKHILDWLSTFFQVETSEEKELQFIKDQWKSVSESLKEANIKEEVPFEVIKDSLIKSLEQKTFGGSALIKGVTISDIGEINGVPSQVICLLGMNSGSFPLNPAPFNFDLMHLVPQAFDFSAKYAQRYLFLQAVLSARKELIISYVGKDIKDNSEQQPSTLVSELLDYLEQRFSKNILNHVLVEHRLQPFHHSYFLKGKKPVSYSPQWYATAEALSQKDSTNNQEKPFFIHQPLESLTETTKSISLFELISFWKNPCQAFLRKRMTMYLNDEYTLYDESEPFVMGGLERYQVQQDLITSQLESEDMDAAFAAEKSKGKVPHGFTGKVWYDVTKRDLVQYSETIQQYKKGEIKKLEISILPELLGGWQIQGELSPFYGEHLFQFRYASLKSGDLISIWIAHLVLNVMSPSGFPRQSLYIPNPADQFIELVELDSETSLTHLSTLLEGYEKGMNEPLPFFPKASYEYAKAMWGKKSKQWEDTNQESAIQQAKKVWHDEYNDIGDVKDPNILKCFGPKLPHHLEHFLTLTRELYEPLFSHQGG